MKKLSLICALLLLSACNSSSNDHGNGGGVVVPPPPPAGPVLDAFFSSVSQYLTPTGEDTDATPIDSVVATEPEDTEPSEFT